MAETIVIDGNRLGKSAGDLMISYLLNSKAALGPEARVATPTRDIEQMPSTQTWMTLVQVEVVVSRLGTDTTDRPVHANII